MTVNERDFLTCNRMQSFVWFICFGVYWLFSKIIIFPHHVLHSLLHPPTTALQNFNLRRRIHTLQFPIHPTHLMDFLSFVCCKKTLIRLCLHPLIYLSCYHCLAYVLSSLDKRILYRIVLCWLLQSLLLIDMYNGSVSLRHQLSRHIVSRLSFVVNARDSVTLLSAKGQHYISLTVNWSELAFDGKPWWHMRLYAI